MKSGRSNRMFASLFILIFVSGSCFADLFSPKNAAQFTLVRNANQYKGWDQAVLGGPVELKDSNQRTIGYLYPVINEEIEVGYISVGASIEFPPVYEFSEDRTPISKLRDSGLEQRAIQVLGRAEGWDLLYFGGLDYYVAFYGNQNRVVFSINRRIEVRDDHLFYKQAFLDDRLANTVLENKNLWSWMNGADATDIKDKAVYRVPGREAYIWYRGCGPTSCTMLLNVFYNQDPTYFADLHINEHTFNWYGPNGWTTVFIDQGLCDLIANYCGVPTQGGSMEQYGVTIYQMRDSTRDVAANRGYSFTVGIRSSDPDYNYYKTEIDQNDPVAFGIYSDGSGSGYDSHAILGYGYNYDGPQRFALVFDTWGTGEHAWAMNASGNDYDFIYVEPPGGSATSTPTRTPTQGATSTPTPTQPTFTPTPTQGSGTVLSWSGGDPDGDMVRYDIYLGITSNPQLVADNVLNSYYNPGVMQENTTYYWKIVAKDDSTQTIGPLWRFTTGYREQPTNTPTRTATPGPGTPTDTPTNTPTRTNTPGPGTPTDTPTRTPTANPSHSPTPTGTIVQNHPPVVLCAGYWDTFLTWENGGMVDIIAVCSDPDYHSVNNVEIFYQGIPTGVFIPAWPHQRDVFWLQDVPVEAGFTPQTILAELVPEDVMVTEGYAWPYLHVPNTSSQEAQQAASDTSDQPAESTSFMLQRKNIFAKVVDRIIGIFRPVVLQPTSSGQAKDVSWLEKLIVPERGLKTGDGPWEKGDSISGISTMIYSAVDTNQKAYNQPPYEPSNPNPPDGATGVDPN